MHKFVLEQEKRCDLWVDGSGSKRNDHVGGL